MRGPPAPLASSVGCGCAVPLPLPLPRYVCAVPLTIDAPRRFCRIIAALCRPCRIFAALCRLRRIAAARYSSQPPASCSPPRLVSAGPFRRAFSGPIIIEYISVSGSRIRVYQTQSLYEL